MSRLLDLVFFAYFLCHVIVSIVIDFQVILPAEFYPQKIIDLKTWYCTTFRDSLLNDQPAWYKSTIVCEILQFPFFFCAMYGFLKGARRCQWLRLPSVVYGTHVVTVVVTIGSHILVNDFSRETSPSPRNMCERLTLFAFYSPFLVLPFLLVLHALFSPEYKASDVKQQPFVKKME